MDQYKLEELETSLLIQKDENDALKAALKSTLEAKEEGKFGFFFNIYVLYSVEFEVLNP